MNPSLVAMLTLADAAPVTDYPDAIAFEVCYEDGEVLLDGYYRPGIARDRQAFAQAVGKLLAAGYEVPTFRGEVANVR